MSSTNYVFGCEQYLKKNNDCKQNRRSILKRTTNNKVELFQTFGKFWLNVT
jgi:hypothetical protein